MGTEKRVVSGFNFKLNQATNGTMLVSILKLKIKKLKKVEFSFVKNRPMLLLSFTVSFSILL